MTYRWPCVRWGLTVGVIGGGILACDRKDAPRPTGLDAGTPSIARFLIGDAASALSPRGQFELSVPAIGKPLQLSGEEASARAEAWARQFGPFLHGRLEQEHGASLDITTLTACPRPMYADTPYEDGGGDPITPVRNIFGPWWLVSLCTPTGEPAVSVAVAAYGTEVQLERGRLKFPPVHGANFFAVGIPRGIALPVSPERAAEMAASTTGRRVTAVPYLVLVGRPHAPQAAMWRISLDGLATADVPASGRRVTTSQVFIGGLGREAPSLFVAAPSDGAREAEWVYIAPRKSRSDPVTRIVARALLKTDGARGYERAVPMPPGR